MLCCQTLQCNEAGSPLRNPPRGKSGNCSHLYSCFYGPCALSCIGRAGLLTRVPNTAPSQNTLTVSASQTALPVIKDMQEGKCLATCPRTHFGPAANKVKAGHIALHQGFAPACAPHLLVIATGCCHGSAPLKGLKEPLRPSCASHEGLQARQPQTLGMLASLTVISLALANLLLSGHCTLDRMVQALRPAWASWEGTRHCCQPCWSQRCRAHWATRDYPGTQSTLHDTCRPAAPRALRPGRR